MDRVPYEDFDALCFELVDVYRRGAELYRERSCSKEGISQKPDADLKSGEQEIR